MAGFPADSSTSAQLGTGTVTTTSDTAPAGTDGNQVAQLADGAWLEHAD